MSVGIAMQFSSVAVAVAAVAACNGREPAATSSPPAAPGPAPAFDATPVTATRTVPAAVPAAMPAAVIDGGTMVPERRTGATLVADARLAADAGLAADAALVGGGPAGGDVASTDALIAEAFLGHPPALPLLSADGKVAAIDLSRGIGMSSFGTYMVGFLEATGGIVERIAVIDHTLAMALLADGSRAHGAPAMAVPRQRLAKAAALITRRLATFTAFAEVFDFGAIQRAHGKLGLGSDTLAFHEDEATGLELRLIGSNGTVVHRERIPVRPRQFTDRDGGRCGGQPRLSGVWWDPARHRAVLQINFPGHDSCEDEPLLWRLW